MKFTYTQELELKRIDFFFEDRIVQILPALGFTGLKVNIFDEHEPFARSKKIKVSLGINESWEFDDVEILYLKCEWVKHLLQGEFLSEEQVQKLITLINQIKLID